MGDGAGATGDTVDNAGDVVGVTNNLFSNVGLLAIQTEKISKYNNLSNEFICNSSV